MDSLVFGEATWEKGDEASICVVTGRYLISAGKGKRR